MLVGSILIHIISLLAIKRQKYLITPQILHNGDATQKSRHNRTMVTLKAVGAFLLFYFFVAGMLFVFSRAKREPFSFYCCTCTKKLLLMYARNVYLSLIAGQTLAQLLLWCSLGPLHTFLTQSYLLANPDTWSYIKRTIINLGQ